MCSTGCLCDNPGRKLGPDSAVSLDDVQASLVDKLIGRKGIRSKCNIAAVIIDSAYICGKAQADKGNEAVFQV